MTMVICCIFYCSDTVINIGGEQVDIVIKQCWSAIHIAFCVVSIVAAICLIQMLLMSFFFLSLNYLESPVPWSDDSLLVRLVAVIEKIILAIILTFDPKVALLITIG